MSVASSCSLHFSVRLQGQQFAKNARSTRNIQFPPPQPCRSRTRVIVSNLGFRIRSMPTWETPRARIKHSYTVAEWLRRLRACVLASPPTPSTIPSSCSRVTVLSPQVARSGRSRRRRSTTTRRTTTTTVPCRCRYRHRAHSASKNTALTDSPMTWAHSHLARSSAGWETHSSLRVTPWKLVCKRC